MTARSSEVESPACRRKNEELDVTIMVRLTFNCQILGSPFAGDLLGFCKPRWIDSTKVSACLLKVPVRLMIYPLQAMRAPRIHFNEVDYFLY